MNQPPNLPADARLKRPQRMSAVRIVVIAVALAAVGIMIIPGFYWEERIRGQLAWRNYEREAKARGVKLDFADFIPPKIPDAENFASIPIFEAVFRASDAGQDIPNPFKLPKPLKGELPKFSDPIKQAPIDVVAWQKYFVEAKLLSAAGDNAAADVLKALDHFAEPLAQLRDAARRPHCRFPVHWERGPAAALPQFGLLQDTARLYALRLAAHLTLGDHQAASEDFRDGMTLVAATANEPSIIPGLVRISIAVIMENALWGGLATHQWNEADLRQIEAELESVDFLKDYIFAMSSERAASTMIADLVIKDPRVLTRLSKMGDSEDSNPTRQWAFLFYPSGWGYQSKVRMNRYFGEMLARIDFNQRRWFGERAIPSSPDHMQDMGEKIRYMLVGITVPAFDAVEKNYLHAVAFTDHARLACTLERVRLAHGSYPATLDELAPGFLPVVAMEVVNGKPYHYRRTEDGSFVLYSVGTNLRDDGGVIDPKLKASKQLDWVWRYPTK